MANSKVTPSSRLTLQQKRHQMLTNTPSIDAHLSNNSNQLPNDTLGAIQYLLDLLRPSRVKQQKVFPRAQLIKDGTIRKFYLAGTGSDEFAIMFTSDYVALIQQAKKEYLKDIKEASQQTTNNTSGGSKLKRKLDTSNSSLKSKKLAIENESIGNSRIGGKLVDNTEAITLKDNNPISGEGIFDRFEDLVTSGHYMEISIQHSNIQDVIGATDQDITLSAPANPHLINLNQSVGRGNNANSMGSGNSSNTGSPSSHSALNQLINTTNQEQAKSVKPETTNVSSTLHSTGVGTIVAPTVTISATLGRRERVSDDVAYRFAFPQGGLFVTQILKGRLEILRSIKRQTFKDMLTSAVISKPLRGSLLPHEFHIHDIVGSGRVQSVTTTSGQLLKLTQKGEANAKTK
ncbi:hypothetical protein BGZ49_003466 [Haplosporangium sp. Z 27]|nr:hypothetical protein BGZ49_003466 [Haplosporangium sp. Z 27]